MKKFFAILFIAIFALAINNYSFSQVTVNPNTATYGTLGAAFTAINSGTHGAGAIAVTITANTTETAFATLLGGVFTSCTIMPTAAVTVSGSFNEAIIVLDGADNVIIDGRIGGTGSTRSLTITNTDPGINQGCIRMSNGASSNVVRYTICNGVGVENTAGGRTINIGQSTTAVGNNNNIIENNLVNGGRRGIQTFGTAGLVTNDGTIIRNNIVKNASSLNIFVGSEVIGNTVEGNEIFNDAAVAGDIAPRGINIQGVGTANVTRNYLHDWTFATFAPPIPTNPNNGVIGIITIPVILTAPGSNTSTVNIINNMFSLGGNTIAEFMYGIFPAATTGGVPNYTVNTYYNSVRIIGSSGATLGADTRGIVHGMSGSGSVYNCFNNVVRNDRTGGGAGTFHIGSDLNPQFAASPDSVMTVNADYNTVWASDAVNGWDAGLDGTIYAGGAQQYRDSVASSNIREGNFTLENSELHTAFRAVDFVSTTDLHLVASLVGGDMNALPVPAVTTIDFDGQSRSPTYPFRGADEIGPATDGAPFKILSLGVAIEAVSLSAADVITVELRNSATGAVITSSTGTVPPAPSNVGFYAFGNLVANGTPFYIRVIYRNALSVWSASPQSFTLGSLNYDFTTAITQAYTDGSGTPPMKLIGGEWSLFSGDVLNDGSIDGIDVGRVFNLQQSSGGNQLFLYATQDLNFDDFADGFDLAFVYNNSQLNLYEQAPFVPQQVASGSNQKSMNRIVKMKKSQKFNIELKFNN